MENDVLKRKAVTTIQELNFKIQQLKSKRIDEGLQDKFDETLKNLEELRDKMQGKYDEFDNNGTDKNWGEFDKQIYTDIDSFNTAYTRAGKLFDPK